jgi:hypothetical protein
MIIKEPQISKEDLDWLYYGDEYHQIIAKLTNEENEFKNEIYKSMSETSNTLIETLVIFIRNVYNDRYTRSYKRLFKNEINRLKILDQKYKLNEYYDIIM